MAMTRNWLNVIRKFSLAIALMNCATLVPAQAQTISIPPRSPIAYAADVWGFPCNVGPGGGACDAGGTWQIIGSVVVTPFGQTYGPWDSNPTWSPDATRIAYVSDGQIVLMDARYGGAFAIGYGASPAWSPDGGRLAFAAYRDGGLGIYVMNPDGSQVVRLAGYAGQSPTWSPDSSRIAFTCEVEASNLDVCVVNSDGTGFIRLTDDPGGDRDPAWSPNGDKIAFVTTRYGGEHLVAMNTDGSGVSQLGGVQGREPAWSSDGRHLAANSLWSGIFGMNADGSGVWWIAGDTDVYASHTPSWMPGAAVPRFSTNCNGLICSFDASSSLGAITNYTWNFGDGLAASGRVVSHAFAQGGTHTISLVVAVANGATATEQVTVTLNRPPVASFVAACSRLTCTFDGRASSDSDGTIVDYFWKFGDGTAADIGGSGDTGKMISHTYSGPGAFSVLLTVRDNSGATGTYSLDVGLPGVHIGDLDAAISPTRSFWTVSVTVMVHDEGHRPVANATVNGSWNGVTSPTSSCTTTESGVCAIAAGVPNSMTTATFKVVGVAAGNASYDATRNHDIDNGTNGTSVTVRRR